MNVEQSSFSGMMFTVSRRVRIKYFAGNELINEARFNSAILDNARQAGDCR